MLPSGARQAQHRFIINNTFYSISGIYFNPEHTKQHINFERNFNVYRKIQKQNLQKRKTQ